MSVLQSEVYRLETHFAEIHQHIHDDFDLVEPPFVGRASLPAGHLALFENILNQLSFDSRDRRSNHSDKLATVIANSRDCLRSVVDSLDSDVYTRHLSEVSWLISVKASIYTLISVLSILSENLISLDEEIKYWDGVLESDWLVGLYGVQASPVRMWRRYMKLGHSDCRGIRSRNLNTDTWSRFYRSVQRCVSPRSLFRAGAAGLSSFLGRSKLELQRKRRKLKTARDYNANAIGLLFEECLSTLSSGADAHMVDGSGELTTDNLRRRVLGNIKLLKSILRSGTTGTDIFELTEKAATKSGDVPCEMQVKTNINSIDKGDTLSELICILTDLLPRYRSSSADNIKDFGRPPPAVRYWLPLSLTLISATTSLKIAKNIGPVIIDSLLNLGTTAVEFWKNWVVGPTWKLLRTIRHNESSEIALMSKNSLEADRASLERMVVDFVLDRDRQSQHALSPESIAVKVREGDLTPVLRAYEKDLRSPFVGTVRGDLVRALLIQIQKTKVDVELAMSGIDALLKSQELVFGFIGLTPGLLISYTSLRWFLGFLGNRKGFRMGKRHDDLRYSLRNIHRILSTSNLTKSGRLTYRDLGLLICNAENLLDKASSMLNGEDLRAFQGDISDLINEPRACKQLQVAERMAWTFAKWI
ncbi:ATP synthase regulation protein NCA2-domain-containing protein [Aspergillus crustosus]